MVTLPLSNSRRCSLYKLDNRFAERSFTVTVVGCGGTGGFTAEELCRLLPERAQLVLVDHDRVEENNLTRQNFSYEDLGKFKSEVLAQRLSRRYRRSVAYTTLPIAALKEVEIPGLVIGCVDNGLARRDIAEKVKGQLFQPYRCVSWWVDAGNGDNYGQILIGNTLKGGGFDKEGTCFALPLPTLQRPELLAQAPPVELDCAQIAEQGPTINRAMASVVVEVVRRLIEGTCPWMQFYLDLEAGTMHPVFATPEAVKKITKGKEVKHD